MWLSDGHGSFSNFHRKLSKTGFGKALIADFVGTFRVIHLVCWFGLGYLLSAPAPAVAQLTPTYASPDAPADFDQTFGMPPYVFRTYQFAASQGEKIRVEVIIGMINDILQFVKVATDTGEDSRYRAQYEVNITVWDKQKNPVDSRSWKRELVVHNFDATNDRKKLNLEHAAFDLPPGEYEISLEITDRDTGKNLRERRPLKLNAPAGERLRFSSVVFAKPVPPEIVAQRDSLLYNFATVTMNLPITARLNGSGKMAGAAAYFEIYGAPPGETLALQYQLLDWRRQVVQEWQETLTVAQTPVRHLVDFAGKIQQAGLHTFHITAKSGPSSGGTQKESRDKAGTAAVEESFQVQISADHNNTVDLGENKTLLYEPLRYIVKGAEYKRLAEADSVTRDSLVADFWRQRDPDPETPANQLREEFYRRVAYSDMRFASASANKTGWETDRGRIYIKYGPPREVHHQMAEQGAPPYEIWLYPDLDLHFIFRDKTGSGEFELVNR
jgi:GWxTD domain-containing protein